MIGNWLWPGRSERCGIDEAPQLAARIQEFLREIAAQGLSGAQSDAPVVRVQRPPLDPYHCADGAPPPAFPQFVAPAVRLGFEGRHEQTFVSDQDNGLILRCH